MERGLKVKIDIYKSTMNGDKYLSVPSGTDVTDLKLPENIDPDVLSLSPFKSSVFLDPNNPRIALNQIDVRRQINENGYAVHGASIEIKINTN